MKNQLKKPLSLILLVTAIACAFVSCQKDNLSYQELSEMKPSEIEKSSSSSKFANDSTSNSINEKKSVLLSNQIQIAMVEHNRKVSQGVRFKIIDIPSPYDASPWQVQSRTMYTYYVDYDNYPSGGQNYEGFTASEGKDYWVFPTSPGKLSIKTTLVNLQNKSTITLYSNAVSYNIQADAPIKVDWSLSSGSACAWFYSNNYSRRFSVYAPPPYMDGYHWFGGTSHIEWTQNGLYVGRFETLSGVTFPATLNLYCYSDNNTTSKSDDKLFSRSAYLSNCVYVEPD